MADVISTLFGITPRQAELQRREEDLGLGGLFAAATLNPYASPNVQNAYLKQQQAQFALGSLGARGLGSLFGLQDPEVKRAADIESILSQTQEELGENLSNPEVLFPTLVNKLQAAGYGREAAIAAMEGQKAIQDYRLSGAKMQTEQAKTNLNLVKTQKEIIEMQTPKMTTVPAGASVIDAEGNLLFTAPKDKSVRNKVLPPGAILVDDEGNEIARGRDPIGRGSGVINAGTSNEPPTKLRPGETWNPQTGKVEAVEGSELWQKQNTASTKAYKSALSVISKSQEATKKLNALLDPKEQKGFELNFGGYNAYATRMLPAARDFNKRLDSIKSELKSAGLELMRQGGSIGTMTEKEWPIVEQMINTISPELSEPRAREVIQEIIDRFTRMAEFAADIYDTEWNGSQFYKPLPKDSSSQPQTADEYLKGLGL